MPRKSRQQLLAELSVLKQQLAQAESVRSEGARFFESKIRRAELELQALGTGGIPPVEETNTDGGQPQDDIGATPETETAQPQAPDVPGGMPEEPAPPAEAAGEGEPEEGAGTGEAGEAPQGRIQQALKLLGQKANLAKDLARSWLKKYLAPYALVIIGVIIFLVAIGLTAYIIFYAKSGRSGTTPTQASEPYRDADVIAKILSLGGEPDAMQRLTREEMTKFKNYIDQINAATANAETKTKSEKLSGDIKTYLATPTPQLSQQILTKFKELLNHISIQNIPIYSSTTRLPFDIKGYADDLHDGSVLNKNGKLGHNLFKPYTGDGTCDAVDLSGDGDGTTDVYPVFAGKVTTSRGDGHKKWGTRWIVVENNGYRAVYAHLKPPTGGGSWPEKGADVTLATKLGTISRPPGHLHFELSYKGNCVVTTASDQIERAQNPGGKKIGQYLWERMKIILHPS